MLIGIPCVKNLSYLFHSAVGSQCYESREGSKLHSARNSRWIWLFFLLLCTGAACTAKADPVSVTYTATQISGTEWQYSYSLSGSYFSGDDLAVYFPLATSSNLVDLGTGGPDWATFAFQPDSSIPADGEFDMTANVDNPGLTAVFDVQFDYSGAGSPGSQSFILYDPNFNIIDTGATQSSVLPSVPEPAPWILVGSGLVALWQSARRQRRFLSPAK
jgi:hypothetical protein